MTKQVAIASEEVNAVGRARQKRVMRDMQRRLVDHLAAGRTTDMAPATMEVEVSRFTDPAQLEAERLEMFLKLPLVAGLSCDIPNPGDALLFDAAGPSIVVVRNKAGVVKAFLNACRHRSAKVVRECGHVGRLTCPFHGWTYDLDGALIGIPGQEAFDGIDRGQHALQPVPVAEWCGLIFVKAHPGDEAIDVEGYLGSLGPEIRQLGLENATPIKKGRIDVDANWKFAQDTFFEGYHFASLHPSTIATVAFSNVCIHDAFGPHQRVLMPPHYFADWVDKPESEWDDVPYQGIHLLFPNTILYSGHVEGFSSRGASDRQIFGVWRGYPGATPDKSFTLMATYRPLDEGVEDDNDYEGLTDFILNVIETEDYGLCRESQANLNHSAPGAKVLFGRNEPALQSIHRHIAALLSPNDQKVRNS